ncbi:hypothetical protein [Chloroflexus sp.]|uniref:hypothetical protein n=1 Tax=Chloroflexus sp. TaxID=1904827 RepID=UPI002ACE50A8|nr:hypothetical protein [Chloroflexus sp.]
MQRSYRRRIVLIAITAVIWVRLALIPAAIAQSDRPQLQLSNYIDRIGQVLVDFWQLPPTTSELRWRWNQPPVDDSAWEPLLVFQGFAFAYVPGPPETSNPLCQHHTFYAELRDVDGNTTLLSAPLTIDRAVDMIVNVRWPEYAMTGYTNQDTIMVQMIDNNDCTGLRLGVFSIDDEVLYDLPIISIAQSARYDEYPLLAKEGGMVLYFIAYDGLSNIGYLELPLVRDVTPPMVTQTITRVERGEQISQLTISGQFLDVYAPLPWAIEWRFVNRYGVSIGQPVYHVLGAHEVQSEGNGVTTASGSPFQLSVSLGAIPNDAAAVHLKLFDRAGNGQEIEPVAFTVPDITYTVYIPLAVR